jgi:type II secretory pathway component GspD/PulD (secretin)
MKTGKNLFVWVFVLILMVAIAVGDVEQSLVAPGVAKSVSVVVADVGASDVEVSANGRIKVFKCGEEEDFGVRKALALLGSLCGKNIVPTPSVDGPVAFRSLSNVTFEEAMDAILGESFVYEPKGNLIKVYTREEYKKIKEDESRKVQKVFTLYYVNAAEAQKLISPALSERGLVAASTAPPVDTTAGQGGDSLAMHDTLVVYDFPENIEKVTEMIAQIDVRPPAVLIEVTILEAELKDETEFGLDFSTIGGASISLGSTEGIQDTGFASAVTGTGGLTAAFSIDDVTGFIRALESITDTTVLANPKILALNKQAGHILLGESDGYLTTTQVTEEGRVQEVEFLESGTRLRFRPYICKDGYVRMEINPEQSTGEVTVSGDFVLPSKDTTEVKTNIMVKDGKTVVIGGLFREKTDQTYAQVPVLGDLPFIGAIFRQTHDTSIRTELIVLITPHIVYEAEDTYGTEGLEDIKRLAYGSRQKVSPISRSRLSEDRYEKAVDYYVGGNYAAALNELNSALALRPTYLEAIRLREKIMSKIEPEGEKKIERKVIEAVEQEDLDRWLGL